MKSSADIEAEVEATRGQIDRTVEALKDKMHPQELFDEATKIMGETSNKVLTTVVEQARSNPIPIALIGAGIAWLALSQRRPSYEDDYAIQGRFETFEGYEEGGGLRGKITAEARAAAQTAKRKLGEAKSAASGAFAHAKDSLADAGDSLDGVRDKASAFADAAQQRAGQYGRQAQAKFNDTLDTEPLMLAALGLAVGAAVGASLPSSRVERRYFGPTRDKVVDRASELARTSVDEAKDIAQRAYGQVKEELHRQTGVEGEGASLTDKAKSVAEAGVQAVRDEVGDRFAH